MSLRVTEHPPSALQKAWPFKVGAEARPAPPHQPQLGQVHPGLWGEVPPCTEADQELQEATIQFESSIFM